MNIGSIIDYAEGLFSQYFEDQILVNLKVKWESFYPKIQLASLISKNKTGWLIGVIEVIWVDFISKNQ